MATTITVMWTTSGRATRSAGRSSTADAAALVATVAWARTSEEDSDGLARASSAQAGRALRVDAVRRFQAGGRGETPECDGQVPIRPARFDLARAVGVAGPYRPSGGRRVLSEAAGILNRWRLWRMTISPARLSCRSRPARGRRMVSVRRTTVRGRLRRWRVPAVMSGGHGSPTPACGCRWRRSSRYLPRTGCGCLKSRSGCCPTCVLLRDSRL